MSKRFNIKKELEKLYVEMPKALLYETKYKGDKTKGIKPLSNDAKLLYGILLDRTYLSIHKATQENDVRFIDENGDIFIYFVNQAIAEILNFGEKKAISVKKELVEYGLLEEIQQGDKKANRLYLNIVETDKDNLKLYTSNFQEVVNDRKKSEKYRIQALRYKQKVNSVTVGNTMNCLSDSTCTSSQTVHVLSNEQSSNTKEFSNTDLKKSDVVMCVSDKQINESMAYKIQINKSMTIDEKINELNCIILMNEFARSLVYKFIEYSILISEAQIRMLNNCVYDVAIESLDYTVAKGGKSFSYFFEVYKTKEKEDMEKLTSEFVFTQNFKPNFKYSGIESN